MEQRNFRCKVVSTLICLYVFSQSKSSKTHDRRNLTCDRCRDGQGTGSIPPRTSVAESGQTDPSWYHQNARHLVSSSIIRGYPLDVESDTTLSNWKLYTSQEILRWTKVYRDDPKFVIWRQSHVWNRYSCFDKTWFSWNDSCWAPKMLNPRTWMARISTPSECLVVGRVWRHHAWWLLLHQNIQNYKMDHKIPKKVKSSYFGGRENMRAAKFWAKKSRAGRNVIFMFVFKLLFLSVLLTHIAAPRKEYNHRVWISWQTSIIYLETNIYIFIFIYCI